MWVLRWVLGACVSERGRVLLHNLLGRTDLED
jgi:hypothetical protein